MYVIACNFRRYIKMNCNIDEFLFSNNNANFFCTDLNAFHKKSVFNLSSHHMFVYYGINWIRCVISNLFIKTSISSKANGVVILLIHILINNLEFVLSVLD